MSAGRRAEVYGEGVGWVLVTHVTLLSPELSPGCWWGSGDGEEEEERGMVEETVPPSLVLSPFRVRIRRLSSQGKSEKGGRAAILKVLES